MGFLGMFGASDRNAENRTQEYADWYRYKDDYYANEEIRKTAHEGLREDDRLAKENLEDNLRFQEKGILENFKIQTKAQDYEYDLATKAYEKSKEQSTKQLSFNEMAEIAAIREQEAKRKDDLLGVIFEETDSLLNYTSQTTGLKLQTNEKLNEAKFRGAGSANKYTADLSGYQIERSKARSESQVSAQKAIIEGMKAAGTIRARGNSGRSSVKSVLGVMAESGALRANIANNLMFTEQGIDLNVAQLKDMQILDQTMILAAKNAAENDYDLTSSTLDAGREIDKMKISATKESIRDRDKIVKQMISQARMQADLNAEAAVLMQPERLPALTDPRDLYAEYDNPDTEDYLEMLVRPVLKDFPDYEPLPMLDFERDFHYSRGREDAASSNFGDALKLGGMAAMAVGGIASIGAMGATAGAGGAINSGVLGITATGAKTLGTIGTGLTGLSNSFYPKNTNYR